MFHYFWKAMLQRNQRAIQMFIGYDSGVKLCIIKHVDSTEKIKDIKTHLIPQIRGKLIHFREKLLWA